MVSHFQDDFARNQGTTYRMPHLVTSFLRSSNENISHIKASVQRRRSPNSRSQPTRPREGSTRSFSYASSVEGQQDEPAPAVKMPELRKRKSKEWQHHRLSLASLHLGSSKSSKEPTEHPNASLDWRIESPPAMMHGDAENSTGALVSGQAILKVKETPFEVESFEARLEIHVTQKRPFQGHCGDCASQKTEIKSWKFLAEPTTLSKRTHEFPFSVLLEGHLPATTDNSVVSVRYEFVAEAKPKTGPVIKLEKSIDVKRSLSVPENPHHSIRIFPPTNIAASVHYPQVIHPFGSNTLSLRMDGIIKHNVDVNTVEYWKLKRLSWRLEENVTAVAPACPKHLPKGAETKKGAKRTSTKTIGFADLHHGWKADYSPSGNIEAEVNFQCDPNAKVSCDLKSRDGTEITHQLVVEMVIVQEFAPTNNLKNITPTGIARILRMHFGVMLTERAGLGVSWDNETPPIYQDVPPSPPSYICDIPYESIEHLALNGLNSADYERAESSDNRGRSPSAS